MSMVRPVKPVAQKPAKLDRATEYMLAVKRLTCCTCGRHGPSDAHHCRDLPDYDERGLYTRLPGAAQKSGDRDTIPLCQTCHWTFHNRRSEFHRLYGKDYGFIAPTRALLADMELDF